MNNKQYARYLCFEFWGHEADGGLEDVNFETDTIGGMVEREQWLKDYYAKNKKPCWYWFDRVEGKKVEVRCE